ncbi:MAG: hypothetical protein QGI47_01470 [Candidatus Marinimicrobia bacterium]|jgi:hypothetical protein|nr:hypothetical protein [Candidatus Neomarinimicrobiota bacterium]|tara:strand:- start:173 stop:382 length:210 start_codon:yes stop_codon:yes gene_type:complete
MKHQFVWIIVLSSFRNAQMLPNHCATFGKKSGRIAIIGQTDKLVLGSAALGTAVNCRFLMNYRGANPSQ